MFSSLFPMKQTEIRRMRNTLIIFLNHFSINLPHSFQWFHERAHERRLATGTKELQTSCSFYLRVCTSSGVTSEKVITMYWNQQIKIFFFFFSCVGCGNNKLQAFIPSNHRSVCSWLTSSCCSHYSSRSFLGVTTIENLTSCFPIFFKINLLL